MAHDQSAIRHSGEESRERFGEVRAAREIISAAKCRIGGDAKPLCLAAKAETQDIDHDFLAVSYAPCGGRTAALPDPGVGGEFCNGLAHSLAQLRKQVNVLVAIDAIRRLPERRDESSHLRDDFALKRRAVEAAQGRSADHRVDGK